MRLNSLTIAAAPLLLAASSYGAIQTITFSDTIDNGSSYFASGASGTFDVEKFDSSLGTLVGVELTITAYATNGVIAYENLNASKGTKVTFNVYTELTVTGTDSLIAVATPVQSIVRTVSAYDGTTDFGGTSGFSTHGGTASDTISTSLTSPADFSAYIATFKGDVMTYSFESAKSAWVNGISFRSETTDTKYYFSYEVTYTYDTVPEAASLSILSLAGFGLLIGRGKKKA